MARMRYAKQALELIKEEDPDSGVTLNFIRALAASGKIPVVNIGRGRLINVDEIIKYLADPEGYEGKHEQNEQPSRMRKVPENVRSIRGGAL